ncbi:MAG: tRNA (adenosine(37)-N6)-dimethylallyltransferase MiaA [Rhodospirillales bacterium]|nr:tRNA (adenosine(37)-N6)-dimethylallyltransferase MiaA [Rhodospirillales bacterium]
MGSPARSPVYVIAGPTASGKSSRAVELALRIDGVLINADSIQLYDALPLLTAAPAEDDKARVGHRLYGVLASDAACSARKWSEMALSEIASVRAQGRVPLLVGGTGFYLKALIEGFSPIPDIPQEVRAGAVDLQARLGNPAFHAHLAARDPVMGARLHPHDTQRLIRAFEVLDFTGRSLAEWQAEPKTGGASGLDFQYDIILPDRAALYESCDRRFDTMMAAGALEEVADFDKKIKAGLFPDDAPPTRALGFRELQAYLRGRMSLTEAITQAKVQTRHYAKRQVTWFRNQMPWCSLNKEKKT